MSPGSTRGIEISPDELMAVRREALELTWQDLLVPQNRQLTQSQQLSESRGMEYRESRAYVVGDDFRSIDWRAMARSGEAYTKIFSDQRQPSATIAIDLSASMYFGTRYSFKSWTAARLAAFIVWMSDRYQLTINCLINGHQGLTRLTSAPARRNLSLLFRELSQRSRYNGPVSDQQDSINGLLARSIESIKPGATFFLLSDCLSVDAHSNRLLSRIERQCSTIVCRVYDQAEVSSWPRGTYSLRLEDEPLRYRHLPGKQPTPLEQLQSKIETRISRFTAIASGQLYLSCNEDLGQQLRKPAVTQNDA